MCYGKRAMPPFCKASAHQLKTRYVTFIKYVKHLLFVKHLCQGFMKPLRPYKLYSVTTDKYYEGNRLSHRRRHDRNWEKERQGYRESLIFKVQTAGGCFTLLASMGIRCIQESIQTAWLFPHFVRLQPYSKCDEIVYFPTHQSTTNIAHNDKAKTFF